MSTFYYVVGMTTKITKVGSATVDYEAQNLHNYNENFSVVRDEEDQDTLIWTGENPPTLNLNIEPISFAGTRPPHRPH